MSQRNMVQGMIPHLHKIEQSYMELESHINKQRAITYFGAYCSQNPDQAITFQWGVSLLGYGAEITLNHLLNLTGCKDYAEIIERYHGKLLSDLLTQLK